MFFFSFLIRPASENFARREEAEAPFFAMRSSTTALSSSAPSRSDASLVLLLTFGVFGIIATEMGVAGIIPQIAERFDVSVPAAGWTVSAFALVVSACAPFLPAAMSGVDRRKVMLATLTLFTLSNVVALLSTSFAALLAARMLAAVLHPVYTAMAFTLAAQASPEDPSRGIARVFTGVSAGMVLGVPWASFVTTHVGYEAATASFGLANLVALLVTWRRVPPMPAKRIGLGTQLRVLRSPALLLAVAAFAALNGAMFGFFSFLSDFLHRASGFDFDAVSAVLFGYGLANIVGNVLAGRFFGKGRRVFSLAVPPAMFAAYALLYAAADVRPAAAGLVLALGVAAGFASIVGQNLIATAARRAPDLANGLFLSAANFGTALGTAFCGAFIGEMGTKAALFGTLLMLVLAFVLVALRLRAGSIDPEPVVPKATQPEGAAV